MHINHKFSTGGDLAMETILVGVRGVGGAPDIEWIEARDAAKSRANNYLVVNVSSAEIER